MQKAKDKDKELHTDLRKDNGTGFFFHAVASSVSAPRKPINNPDPDVSKNAGPT